jgi:hypothetical protein
MDQQRRRLQILEAEVEARLIRLETIVLAVLAL